MEPTIIGALVLTLFAGVLLFSSRDAVAELAGVLLFSSRDAAAKLAGVTLAAGKAMNSLSFISVRTDSPPSGKRDLFGCEPILFRVVFISSCKIEKSLAHIQMMYGKDCFLSGGITLAVCFEKGAEPIIEECTAKISKFFYENSVYFYECRLLELNPDDKIMKYRINPELRGIANSFGHVASSEFSTPPSGNEIVDFGYSEFLGG